MPDSETVKGKEADGKTSRNSSPGSEAVKYLTSCARNSWPILRNPIARDLRDYAASKILSRARPSEFARTPSFRCRDLA